MGYSKSQEKHKKINVLIVGDLYHHPDKYVYPLRAQFPLIDFHIIDILDLVHLDNTELTLTSLAKLVIREIELLDLQNIILIGNGLGSSICFEAGLCRPDLIALQILIGISNNKVNNNLKEAKIEIMRYALKHSDCIKTLQSIEETLSSMNVSTVNFSDERVKKGDNLKKLCALYDALHGQHFFGSQQMIKNKIPNHIFASKGTAEASLGDVVSFAEMVGTNQSMHVLTQFSSNFELVMSDEFLSSIKHIIYGFQEKLDKTIGSYYTTKAVTTL